MNLSRLSERSLLALFRVFNRFMVMIWRLGLGAWGNGTRYGGNVMVIGHVGRKTGSVRRTPANYAQVRGAIYCISGLGPRSDWYRNIMRLPIVELWLPDGRWAGIAQDATGMKDAGAIFRRVILASGFAAPLFGVNASRLTDEEAGSLLQKYRLLRISLIAATAGPQGPGDLAWVWPLSTLALVLVLLVVALA